MTCVLPLVRVAARAAVLAAGVVAAELAVLGMSTPRLPPAPGQTRGRKEPAAASEAKAKAVFENLYPKETILKTLDEYVAGIDSFIDELQNHQNETESKSYRFALIHDLFL